MKKYSEYLPLVLLSLFTLKLLVLNTWSFENALVLIGLVILSAVFHVKAKVDVVQEINDKIDAQAKEIEELKKQNDYIKSSFANMKMAAGIKPAQMKF